MKLRPVLLALLLCLLVAAPASASQTVHLPLVIGAPPADLPKPPVLLSPAQLAWLDTISPEFIISNWRLLQAAWAQLELFAAQPYAHLAQADPVAEFTWHPFYGLSTAVLLYNLEPDTTYYWHVRASYDGIAWGPWSSLAVFTTEGEGTLPATPALILPADGATGVSRRPPLSWSEVQGVTRYAVLLGPTGALQGFLADEPPFVPFEDLQAGTGYEWLVYARNGYGWGPYSETWTFQTE